MEVIFRWLLIMVLVYLAGGGLLYYFQRMFLYFPRSYVEVPELREVKLTSGGVELHGYIANSGNDQLLLYFGGNAERIARGVAQLADHLPSTTIIGFDYRGYGKSGGGPSEEALYQDALRQFDAYAQQYRRVSLLGRSLGSAVAVYLASQRAVDRLILVTPIDSVLRIAAARFWFYPIHLLLRDRYDARSRADEVEAPVLMLAAADDHLVSRRHLRRLKDGFAAASVELVSLEGVGHDTIQNSPQFYDRIRSFLGKAPAKSANLAQNDGQNAVNEQLPIYKTLAVGKA